MTIVLDEKQNKEGQIKKPCQMKSGMAISLANEE